MSKNDRHTAFILRTLGIIRAVCVAAMFILAGASDAGSIGLVPLAVIGILLTVTALAAHAAGRFLARPVRRSAHRGPARRQIEIVMPQDAA